MNISEFGNIALENRYIVVKRLVLMEHYLDRNAGNHKVANMILSRARKLNLVDKKYLAGNLMKQWLRKRIVPSWSALAALDLLIERKWIPTTEKEWIVYFFLFTKLMKYNDTQNIDNFIPDYLPQEIARYWFSMAIENQDEFNKRKLI